MEIEDVIIFDESIPQSDLGIVSLTRRNQTGIEQRYERKRLLFTVF
jgi:hypothetical protein